MKGFVLIEDIVDYDDALIVQRKLNEMVNDDALEGAILILEHKDVYTCGIHKDKGLVTIGQNIRMVERGGGITYHNPGQIVSYFILNLKVLNLNARTLIGVIHNELIEFMTELDIHGESRLGQETGIWTDNKKICSTGIALKGNATLHGSALNYINDMTGFQRINPCGFNPDIMTSCKEISPMDLLPISKAKEEIGKKLCRALKIDFNNRKNWKEVKEIISEQSFETAP